MNKFFLQLTNTEAQFWDEKLGEIMSLTRKFQSICVALNESFGFNVAEKFVKISAKHGAEVKTLDVFDAKFRRFGLLKEILGNFPRLKTLELRNIKASEEKHTEFFGTPVILDDLETVKVENCNWQVFNVVSGQKIRFLRIGNSEESLVQFDFVIKFLTKLINLETFEVAGKASDGIFSSEKCKKFNFNLKSFCYGSNFIDDQTEINENLNHFLQTQGNFLKQLKIDVESEEILRTIFTKLTFLESISFHAFPMNEIFFDEIHVLENLQSVEIYSSFSSKEVAKAFFSKCPNLERIETILDHEVTPEILNFLSVSNPKTKILTLKSIRNYDGAKFDLLEHFHVQDIENMVTFVSFVMINRSIKTSSVHLMTHENFCDEKFQEFLRQTNIYNFKLNGGIKDKTMKLEFTSQKQHGLIRENLLG